MGISDPMFPHSPRATRAVGWIAEIISEQLDTQSEDWARVAWQEAEAFSVLGIWSEGQRFSFATKDIYAAWRQYEARLEIGYFDD